MVGLEWIVDAYGCAPDRLRDVSTLEALFASLIRDLDLHACGDARWHQFPGAGGITGMTLLTESHLACHSFPEYGTLCLNLFCCRARPAADFAALLRATVNAQIVNVRRLDRPFASAAASVSCHSAPQVFHPDD